MTEIPEDLPPELSSFDRRALDVAYRRWRAREVRRACDYTHYIDLSFECFCDVCRRSMPDLVGAALRSTGRATG